MSCFPRKSRSEFIKNAERLVKSWEIVHKQNILELSKLKVLKIFVNQDLIRVQGSQKGNKNWIENYGKSKIFVILRRDYGIEISESSM